MNSLDHKITNSILGHTPTNESAYDALLHWRWSQMERKRRSIIRQEFKDLAITNTEEYSILVFISLSPTPSASDITGYLTMEKSTVSEFIKRCLTRDLITEEQSPKDKRKKFYRLTEHGVRVLWQAHQRMEIINKKLFSPLSKKEKQSLLQTLVNLKD
jgi:DNA-binding MarR family transcriptional regulator